MLNAELKSMACCAKGVGEFVNCDGLDAFLNTLGG